MRYRNAAKQKYNKMSYLKFFITRYWFSALFAATLDVAVVTEWLRSDDKPILPAVFMTAVTVVLVVGSYKHYQSCKEELNQ